MELEGSNDGRGCRFGIVVSRFNSDVTEGLLRGAMDALGSANVAAEDVSVVRVPGAFELPVTVLKMAESKRVDAVIVLGCLIKGDTMHFEYIAEATSHALMDVSTRTGVPVAFGLLTTLTDEQAEERSRPGDGNKGREAALAAVEMATLLRRLWQASV